MSVLQQGKKGKGDIVHPPAHHAVAVVDEWNPHHRNRSDQSVQKDLIKKAHGPGHLTKILLEMLAKKPKDHHLGQGHLKGLGDHDLDPLKNQGRNPDPSPDLHTGLIKSQRKTNTDIRF